MNRYEFYGNINTYRRNQSNKENELTHYGTLGQKWGVRKWQNPDGTFNEAGKKRYFGSKKTEDDKIGKMEKNGKGQKYNPKYQYPWGGLKEKGEKLLEKNPKKFNKKVNTELYESDKKYNEDLEKNKESNKKIFEENIDLINEIGKKYGYEENGIKNVNSETNGKIQVRTPVAEETWYDFEHQYYEVPDINNKVAKVDSNKIEKDFQKYDKFIENFDNVYNKVIDSTAKVYYDKYKELSENPVSFEEFRDSIKISPYEGNKPVYIHSDDIVGDRMNLFLKSDIPNSPGSFSIASDLDGNLKYTSSFDENYRKATFDNTREEDYADQKIGSSWKSMSDQDYAQVEKEMKKSGWDTNKELKPGNQVYSKPIDNDDYKGIKYEVDAYKFHDNSVDDINKKYQEHINFLNKKDSLKQVLDNFADYEYPYYEKYINNHNKYFDNKLDVISKAEFINAVKSNINLNKTGLSWNDELYMQFVPKENKDFNYFKDMYDVFTIDVDPKSGKVSDFTIV